MYKANINCSVLKEFMDFLIKHDLIEERTIGKKRVVYAITQKGRSVIKVFREIEKILPVEEEGRTKIPIPY
jgi:predicted transcriptional regulator